jgi:shikimate dehydrogenase
MTKLFGLIGYPLSHSYSKKLFTEKFGKLKIDAKYELFPLESIKEFPALIENNPELTGLNVTIPYKQDVMTYLDEIDFAAKMIGAVNTISIKRIKGKPYLKGYNTDACGFEQTLTSLVKPDTKIKALLLGAGGAARSVRYILRKNGIPFRSVGRHNLKTDQLIYGLITSSIIDQYKLIINTTPVGMYPSIDRAPEIPYQYIGNEHILIDLIYNPEETLFLKKGKEKGALTANGTKMFVLQAEEAWKIWQKI